jgi:hypothetical protein
MAKVVLTAALVITTATPSLAFQTEIRQRKVQQMREGLAAWNHEVERREQAWRARVEVREDASSEGPAVGAPPRPPSTYSGGVLTADQVASYARGAGFPEYHVDDMVAISWRESKFCPSAVNGYGCNIGGTIHGSNACGLTQLYPCPGPEALDPATNMAYAFQKYQAAGLSPWGY